ncbi:hypothetical protein LSTR_LSTR004564 [Laodelphax striatellus]|uniref:Uncharacterized protein n=1 Tax=Laodelphax striatellus TaxID=195883 RepID=A0A482WUA3_LAOST|nr:hypothetical protein LSTR_LSTR004564 [Laodelphax striatellus]
MNGEESDGSKEPYPNNLMEMRFSRVENSSFLSYSTRLLLLERTGALLKATSHNTTGIFPALLFSNYSGELLLETIWAGNKKFSLRGSKKHDYFERSNTS